MKLSDWQEEMLADINEFVEYWHTRHKTLPEHYPLEMEPGDWDEQFSIAKECNLL